MKKTNFRLYTQTTKPLNNMKPFLWPVRAFIIVGLLQVVSCTKTVDTVTNDSVSLETSGDASMANEFSNCKLRRIYHEHGGVSGYVISGLFTYNAAGDPLSLIYAQGGTGNPNYFFYYDSKKRLREFREGYSPDDIVEATWHKYGYNSSDQIIVDTILHPGFEIEGEVIPGDTTISLLTYDIQGRIIKESSRNIKGGPTRNPTYTYDARGNLGVNGWKSSSYDNKVSIFRSHPVFQFIHRNYSKNNAAPQAKYNSKGLPLSMNPANDAFFSAYPTHIGGSGISKAIYDCQ
jgi:hypothetical protein